MKSISTLMIGKKEIPVYLNELIEVGTFYVMYHSSNFLEPGVIYAPFVPVMRIDEGCLEEQKRLQELEEQRIIEVKRRRNYNDITAIVANVDDESNLISIAEKIIKEYVGNDTESKTIRPDYRIHL